MNINSNKYTFIYAVVMVVVVAVILSFAATSLAPKQEENVRIEKMQNILRAAMADKNDDVTAKNAIALYNSNIVEEMTVDVNGKVINVFDVKTETFTQGDGRRAFDIDIKEELDHIRKSGNGQLPVFLYRSGGVEKYVIPLYGVGLWGAIWGNLALSSDLRTIQGVVFDHKGETPGLGADIVEPNFTTKFQGKTIFDDHDNIQRFRVVKGGIITLPEAERRHAVDALSGATITSDGVQNMLNDCIGYYKAWMVTSTICQTPNGQ
ncbi:MAG: NADH:ubiquinone reductase (Na(+)-transporting) subunit C [Bacteroidales bacterium]|nr:NADH:ubiquinone reductase (Na(+)-transporting) subunit C [Bacteroidales bacterium]